MTEAKAKDALVRVGNVQRSGRVKMSCPRCGEAYMREPIHTNALSRHTDCYICPGCGTDEAMRDYGRNPLPLSQWSIIVNVLDVLNGEGQEASL